MEVDRREVERALALQARWCRELGSPLYGELLARAARDAAAGGPVWRAVEGDERPRADMLALRLMGATHRLALDGRAPDLARRYPSTGGDGDVEGAWRALLALVDERRDDVRELVARPVQTNEVGRCGALLGGFLEAARATALPLRLLEVGASAGLNLRWDRYRYALSGDGWGPGDSPVGIEVELEGDARPPLDVVPRVVERRGCDREPLDPTTPEGRLTLLSYVWPDQVERLGRLRGALDVAREVPARVERAGADEWVERELARPVAGALTVVFHSIVAQYLDRAARERFVAAIAAAGERASADAPLAWLRMEPGGDQTEVRLTLWPPGEERLLASAQYHGRTVRWRASG
jgi:hypothetical protein